MKKRFMFLSLLSILCLVGCGGQKNDDSTTSLPVEEDNTVSVFVLSGQSNMEGQTRFGRENETPWLNNAFADLDLPDVDVCFDGIEEVQTSFFGCGYGQLTDDLSGVHASNQEDKMQGLFLPTKVGMGNKDYYMGPELGCAYRLREYATKEKPIYFIKCAFSGSGFDQSGAISWAQDKEPNLYTKYLKDYVQNNLDAIEATGKKPVIRGFLWHQGESDSDPKKIPLYRDRMDTLLTKFKTDFASYAKYEDGNNIAFIDALIYDGPNYTWNNVDELNQVKLDYANESELNFCINTSTKLEGGLALEVPGGGMWGGGGSDTGGGDGGVHYKTKDCLRLGMAYADVIIENFLLDD